MWILLIAVLTTETHSEVIKTFCEDIFANKGETATLNFRFSENISQLHRSIRVKHYTTSREVSSPESNSCILAHLMTVMRETVANTVNTAIRDGVQKNVLTCHWLNKTECDVRPTYTFDGMISNELRIAIPDFTENHVGRYLCFVLPAEPGSYQMCNVSLKADKQQDPLKILTNAHTTERNFSILPKETSNDVLKQYPLLPALAVLGGILLIVCVLVIIAARRYYNFRINEPAVNVEDDEMTVRIPITIKVGTSRSKQHINLLFIKKEVTVV